MFNIQITTFPKHFFIQWSTHYSNKYKSDSVASFRLCISSHTNIPLIFRFKKVRYFQKYLDDLLFNISKISANLMTSKLFIEIAFNICAPRYCNKLPSRIFQNQSLFINKLLTI